jgi:RNA polymerase sigma factor (sigma-70 family)
MISGATRPHASSPHRSAAHPKNFSTPPKRPTRAPVISFDRPATTQEGDAATLGERLGDEDPGFEAAEASATLDRLLNTLSERDQLVLRLRFREDLTQTEIARRIGCSQMHVSRIQRAALAQLVQNATTTTSEPNAPEHDEYEELWAQAAIA